MPGFTTFVDVAPGRSLGNNDLPVPFSRIEERTGIRSRNVAGDKESVETIAMDVARKLFERLGISATDCGALILASCTVEAGNARATQKAAERIAKQLQIRGPASGVDFACAGFPAATAEALRLKREESVDRHVLMLAAETLSDITDWSREDVAILFGDRGAGTTVAPDGPHRILDAFAADVDDAQGLLGLEYRTGGVRSNGQCDMSRACYVRMNGRPLYRQAPDAMVRLIEQSFDPDRHAMPGETLRSLSEIATVAHHQANGKFAGKIQKILARHHWGKNTHVLNAIGPTGNTGACSIPSALAREWEGIAPGIVASPAVGAGSSFRDGFLSEGTVVFEKALE
jgi:3-oxoacyl-[acyl-carrier-protein] synthase III